MLRLIHPVFPAMSTTTVHFPPLAMYRTSPAMETQATASSHHGVCASQPRRLPTSSKAVAPRSVPAAFASAC